MHLEVDAQQRQVNGDSLQGVRPGVKHARALVHGFQHSSRRWDAFGDSLNWRVQGYPSAVKVRPVGQRLRSKGAKISLWRLARLESRRCLQLAFDAVDPKSSPILAANVPSHEIPAMASVEEAMRFHAAGAEYAAAVVIIESDSFMITAGRGYRVQPPIRRVCAIPVA